MQAPDRRVAGLPASLGQLRRRRPRPEIAATPCTQSLPRSRFVSPALDRSPALLVPNVLPFKIPRAIALRNTGIENQGTAAVNWLE
jgi:hypothetical protein